MEHHLSNITHAPVSARFAPLGGCCKAGSDVTTATIAPQSHATGSDSHETALLKTQVKLLRDQLEQAQARERRLLTILEEEQRSRRELEMRILPSPQRSFIDGMGSL